MSITNLISYEILGAKEEFAGWVSNISPYDTPFTSLTGKAPVYNRVFEWQTDRLELVNASNAWEESRENLPAPILIPTKVHNNYTQIFRKVVTVSDTANAFKNHGRQSELEYQFEKASKEIKRDLEWTFLSSQTKDDGSSNNTRLMSGFYRLVADVDEVEPNTGAVTHKRLTTNTFTEDDIFDITYNLYISGARANVIMFHPNYASLFNKFFENGTSRVELYTNEDDTVPNALTEVVDPLGQKFILFPNRYMGKGVIYFFHPHDWFQRVLRNPTVYSTDKTGSSEDWVIEMEVSLQHRNPWASGILEMSNYTGGIDYTFTVDPQADITTNDQTVQLTYKSAPSQPLSVTWSSSDDTVATVDKDGLVTVIGMGDVTITASATYPFNTVISSSTSFKVYGIKLVLSTSSINYPSPTGLNYTIDTNIPGGVPSTASVGAIPLGIATVSTATKHITVSYPGEATINALVTFPAPYGNMRDSKLLSILGFAVRPFPIPVVLGTDIVIPEDDFKMNPTDMNPSGRFTFTPSNAWDTDYAEIIESGDDTSGWFYTIHPKMGTSIQPIVQDASFNVALVDDPTKRTSMGIRITGTNTFHINTYAQPVHSGDTVQLTATQAGPATEVATVWTSSNPTRVTVDNTGKVVVDATFKGIVSISAAREFDNGQKINSIIRLTVQ